MEPHVVWIVGLFLAALILAAGEILTPFFGLSLGAGVCLFAAVGIGFRQGNVEGLVTLVAAIALVPAFLWVYLKWLPTTTFGRGFMPDLPGAGIGDGLPHHETLAKLRGRMGTSVSILRPVGACEIDGFRFDCRAESGFIDRGAAVRVLEVDGNRLIVRAV